jgi:NAD(P)-dependent dehydrogenase (short-subunit alcohol dehydrogenase family)
MLLSDKVAIITGGARGMGKGISLKFADEGCRVAIADILEDEAEQTAAEVKQKGGEAIVVKCDQSDAPQVKNVVDKTIEKFGKVDILVNAAGISAVTKFITEYTEEEWDKIFAIHVKGPFFFLKYAVPHMINRKSGNIINISSTVALLQPSGTRTSYAAAKAAVIGLTYNAAVALAEYNIRVNVIVAGGVKTHFFDHSMSSEEREKLFTDGGKNVLLGRMGTPEDIAGVALFLASDLSAYVTSQQIVVGGGSPFRPPAARRLKTND